MKVLFPIGIVVAGIVGYSFEPWMRYTLTGKSVEPGRGQVRKSIAGDTGAPKKAIDASTWPADQLPEKIQLKGDAEIANETGDMKMTITAGNRVNLVRLEGQNVVISPGSGPFQGTVPIIQTDLLDQLAVLEKKPVAPTPDPAPVDPTAIAANATEEPVTEPETAVSGGPDDVVAVMRSSIKAGDIKEFSLDQVLEWKANDEPETIKGESYQTGVAFYKAETVFGVKTIQAKALVQDGKVVRWLWPKSGMEIK